MNLALANAWKHPVSTIRGILSFLAGISLLLAAEPGLVQGIPWLTPHVLSAVVGVSATARLILAIMGKDVDREEAKVPGQPDTKMVPTVGTPTVPGAVPVKEQ